MNIEKFKPRVLDILRSSDLETISAKSVRKILQQGTSEPLDEYKKDLNALIMQCLDIVSETAPPVVKKESPPISSSTSKYSSHLSSAPSTTSIDQPKRPTPPPPRPRSSASNSKKRTSEMIDSDDEDGTKSTTSTTSSSKSTKKKSSTPKKPAKKRNVDAATLQKNPFTKSWLLSDTLSNVTGETALSRPGVVKALWKYIKENQLQDPANKTFIVCDEKLKRVFDGQDRIHCFTMNKFIGKHLSDLPADYVLDGVDMKKE
ncbi:SWIB/MDM2 domain-containing protein [Absidia repens]|uniref:SWIB/MDM2 domain-containing protein n=1 Tax=Absidia repens TaxID=90262 RepID=A0A1X2IR40_9FUNG|nr:SWIB/MDM2 domain-containing protein [Absidia repens]